MAQMKTLTKQSPRLNYEVYDLPPMYFREIKRASALFRHTMASNLFRMVDTQLRDDGPSVLMLAGLETVDGIEFRCPFHVSHTMRTLNVAVGYMRKGREVEDYPRIVCRNGSCEAHKSYDLPGFLYALHP